MNSLAKFTELAGLYPWQLDWGVRMQCCHGNKASSLWSCQAWSLESGLMQAPSLGVCRGQKEGKGGPSGHTGQATRASRISLLRGVAVSKEAGVGL